MKTALFDLDGTLIDSRADLAFAVNLTRREAGLPARDEAAVVACVGDGVRMLVERCIPECPELWDELVIRQKANYGANLLHRTTLYPGVREALSALRDAGWRLAVVTNKPGGFSRTILEGLGALTFFGAVVGGDDAPALKPDPAPLQEAARQLGVTLDAEDWMVGDNVTDLLAGRRAGVRRCFCRYGFGDARGEPFDMAVDRLDAFAQRLLAPVS